jgi:hypothetical protein
MDFRSKQIAAPKSWTDFEDLCHAIFRGEWNDRLAQKNGRNGQPQNGVDVFGSPNTVRDVFHGVQCKGKDRNYGRKPTLKELTQEIAKADSFTPPLAHWVFATSAPKEEKLQQAARELSVVRKAQGLFTVTVLGWEDIQSLLGRHPNVVQDFYPEHAFDIPELVKALRDIPSGQDVRDLLALVRRSVETGGPPSGAATNEAIWVRETFSESRDLGPALLGRSLGPADAGACPRLQEVDMTISQLRRAFFVRLVGGPGSGKSVCAYQAAGDLAASGWKVFRLRDTAIQNPFPLPTESPALLLIDDAHLMTRATLQRIEETAGQRRMVLSILNGVEDGKIDRGAVLLDSKRAVRTIAAALRADAERTLATVRRIDDDVGTNFLKEPLERRIEHAESVSDRPWQFCFVLGGGWKRSKEAADAARVAGADLVLAAAGMIQVASRDAPLDPNTLRQFCMQHGMAPDKVAKAIGWLVGQRLVISEHDCRCPHQRFAVVALGHILAGQDDAGRAVIGGMLQAVVSNSAFPLPGLRILLHEVSFLGEYGRWTRLVSPQSLEPLVARCWTATSPEDRAFAAFILSDLSRYLPDWPQGILRDRIGDIAQWISRAVSPAAYGLFDLLNSLRQKDEALASAITESVDPVAVANALSAATPETAAHLGEVLKAIGWKRSEGWKGTFDRALDKSKIIALASSWPPSEHLSSFAALCAAISAWNEDLGLLMVEAFIPIAQRAFAENPVSAFHELDDIVDRILRISDPLGVYVGKFAPKARHSLLAKAMCAKLNPKLLAVQLSAVHKRDLQDATFFLGFLKKARRSKFVATVRALDWSAIEKTIGDDWENLPHEAEIFLTVSYSDKRARDTVQDVVFRNLSRIEKFSPRVACIAPKAAFAHVEAGKPIRLAQHGHCAWRFGAVIVSQFAQERPYLVNALLAPWESDLGAGLSQQNSSWFTETALFIEVLIEKTPENLERILAAVDAAKAEEGWADSLERGDEPRRAAALLVEVAISRTDHVGEMARRLRKRFRRSSVPTPRKSSKRAIMAQSPTTSGENASGS